MASAEVDLPFVSSFLGVPVPSLASSTEPPSAALFNAVLQSIAVKAREHNDLKAEKLRQEVEFDHAVRSAETRARSLKSAVEQGLKEAAELRSQVNTQESARAKLESELQTLKSSLTTSSSEVEKSQSRISTLEASNRNTLALLESKSTAHDQLAKDLFDEHQKNLELKRQVSALEQTIQSNSTAASSAKFRESNLVSELELIRKSNEYYESELKAKAAEVTKIRRDKGATISELKRLHEDAESTVESLRRTENTLRNRLEDIEQQADSSFTKVQQLQDDASKHSEDSRRELENSKRLAALLQSNLDTTKKRLLEVVDERDRSKEDAATRVAAAETEKERERSDKESAEEQVKELEYQVERLEIDLSNLRNAPPSVPGTPRLGAASSFFGRAGSPSSQMFSPGGSRSRFATSQTDLVTDCSNLRTQLDKERRLSRALNLQLSQLQQDLEESYPQVQEMREDRDRLEGEVSSLSSLLQTRGKEQESAKKDARKWEGQVEGLRRENDVLKQQLRDLSAQISCLLDDQRMQQQGLDPLTAADELQRERAAKGIEADEFDGFNSTGIWITQNLVEFRNVVELQAKNVKLLHAARDLSERIDTEERKAAENSQDSGRVRSEKEALQTEMSLLKIELQSQMTRAESIAKERDMYQRMIHNRNQRPSGGEVNFSQSMRLPDTSGDMMDGVQSNSTADLSKSLKDLTTHFDIFRNESIADSKALKEQTDSLFAEKNRLQSELNRSNTQLTLAGERYEMLQANFAMAKTEMTELQKRASSISENATKQDYRSQQLTEELIEAKSLADSARNEISNLKAEKDLAKKIEKRLGDDNESLLNERNRLNMLLNNLQNLQNEREHSDSENRSRLQAQIDGLETELQTTKRKLSDELEDGKRATLRREYESNQSQQRIDDLMKSIQSSREELVAAKTARDMLQARNQELMIELRSAEERVQLLQPRPTPRAPAQVDQAAVSNGAGDDEGDREQELALEVSELKRDVELAKSELEVAKSQVEQYQQISRASEEELQSLNETQDQYRVEMDAMIEERDVKIRNAEQRIEDLLSELDTRNEELTSLHTLEGDLAKKFEQEKADLGAEIVRLTEQDARHSEVAQFHQEDLKAQAEIAQQAQQNYENELVKHAEAAQSLQSARAQLNELKTEVVTLRSDAEATKLSSSQNEISWIETKERYDLEFAELRSRREDANTQNRLLHQQLESVSNQIAALKQNRSENTTFDDPNASMQSDSADQSLQDLREVIRYLRREKEIVDVQYELSIQESKRMKQQLDYAQSQLDDTRLRLDQERRTQADLSRSSMTQTQLLEKINELNLFRESNTTLRNENKEAQIELTKKSARIEELLQQVQPLDTKVKEMELDKESTASEMRLLQEDRDRYMKRNQDILSKYQRIDPAELEELKTQLETLKSERDQLAEVGKELEAMKEKVESIPSQIEAAQEEAVKPWQAQKEKVLEQARNGVRKVRENLTEEISKLQQELSETRTELEEVRTRQESVQTNAAENAQNTENNASILDPEQASSLRQLLELAKQEKAASENQLEASRVAQAASQARIAELEGQVQILDERLANSTAQLTTLQEDLAMRDSSQTLGVTAPATTIDGSDNTTATTQEQIEKIHTDLTADYDAKYAQLQENFKKRSDKMKDTLNAKLKEGKEAYRSDVDKEYQTIVDNLKAEHAQQIQQLEQTHLAEVHKIKSEEPRMMDSANGTTNDTPSQVPTQYTPTEQEVRELIGSHPVAASIVRNNITKKLAQEREQLSQAIRAEQGRLMEQKLAEASTMAEAAKLQAVAFEGKRYLARLSMTDNRYKTANAKIVVIEKAAQETPARPVGEVWAIAKSAKPPAAPPTPTPAGTAPAPATPTQTATGPAQPATNGEKPDTPDLPKTTSSLPDRPLSAQSAAPVVPAIASLQNALGGSQPNLSSGIPRGSANRGGRGAGRGGQRGGITTNPAPQAGGQMSEPTQPRGGTTAASNLPRGGVSNRGRGRGSGPAVQTSNLPQAQAVGSPGSARGGMNASAKQFVPGNKRAREGESDGGQAGKRARGGGAAGEAA
ncbi:MAG: hypothetical protein M1814_005702 [Vezdaea aestivalis]|nr:MAG: hypothetical protein M1814_005702 [Vezdaea aestivalis]